VENSELNKLLQVGNKIRIVYPPDSPKKTRLIHIRAEVDTHYYAFCYWSKRQWVYDLQSFWWFEAIAHRLEYVGRSIDFKDEE